MAPFFIGDAMIKIERKYDFDGESRIKVYSRLVTPFFYRKLKTRSYDFTIRRSVSTPGLYCLFLCIPEIPAPKGKIFEIGCWDCDDSEILSGLNEIKKGYVKLVSRNAVR
jgi:hypothetical protein